jgi:hypothetical protein
MGRTITRMISHCTHIGAVRQTLDTCKFLSIPLISESSSLNFRLLSSAVDTSNLSLLNVQILLDSLRPVLPGSHLRHLEVHTCTQYSHSRDLAVIRSAGKSNLGKADRVDWCTWPAPIMVLHRKPRPLGDSQQTRPTDT